MRNEEELKIINLFFSFSMFSGDWAFAALYLYLFGSLLSHHHHPHGWRFGKYRVLDNAGRSKSIATPR